MGERDADSADVTDLDAYRQSRRTSPEPDVIEVLHRIEKRLERLEGDRVSELERQMDALEDELADFQRKLEEVEDTAYTGTTRATLARNEVDRVLSRVNNLVARLNN